MREIEEKVRAMVKPGTTGGKVFYGALFFVIGLLFINYGFWKTVLVLALASVGVLIGSAETLGKAVGKVVDKIVPAKNQKVVYTSEDMEKVKKVAQARKEARQEAEAQAEEVLEQKEQA